MIENNNALLSIIVPIYNVEKFLPKCIESIMRQSYRNLEIILVDDGSSDCCLEICGTYAALDERIHVIHQVNSGVSAARNTGLEIASGEFIGFVDPDDWIASDMYEGMLEAMLREQVDLAICGYDYYREDGNVDETRRYLIRDTEIISQKDVLYRFGDMPPSIRHGVCNKLFKNNLLHTQRFICGLHSSEDVMFLTDYVLKIENAVIVHKPYYKNLVRMGSATHGGLNIESLADSFKVHDHMYCATVELYPELRNHSLAFLLDVCTLKYNEAVNKLKNLSEHDRIEAQKRLKEMKKYIKRNAISAIFDSEIYWKTKISYILF